MPRSFTAAELDAYLDEALPPEAMAAVEAELRARPALAAELAAQLSRRDAGGHSLGEIWRRERLTCPARQELASYLLGVLPADAARYVAFHLDEVGCRLCLANAADLKQQAESAEESRRRRARYFQSSAGRLRRK